MRIPLPPPLQRDMYAGWDSGSITKKPMKDLEIKNVQKLAGMRTQAFNKIPFHCTAAVDVNDEYYQFEFKNIKDEVDLELHLYKMIHQINGFDVATIQIREIWAPNKVSEWYGPRHIKRIDIVSIDTFLMKLGHLCSEYVDYVKQKEYENSPWYNKFWVKTKEFINNI